MKSRIPQTGKNIVLSGNENEFSSVSNEITSYLDGWLASSGLQESEMRYLISFESYKIVEDSYAGDKRISMICNVDQGELRIGEPFVWLPVAMSFPEFQMTVALILIALAKQYESYPVEDAVRKYAKTLDK